MPTMPPAAAKALAWLRQNILLLCICIMVLASAAVLRSCYYGGQVAAILNANPRVLTRRQAAVIVKAAAQDQVLATKATAAADSGKRVIAKKERRIQRQQAHIDSLTTELHEISLDTLSDAAAGAYLFHYVPGPDGR